MSESGARDSAAVLDHATRVTGSAAALAVAVQLGVAEALLEGPERTAALAQNLDLDPAALERLLGVLAALDLVERQGDRWAIHSELVRAGGEGASNARSWLHLWSSLADHVRTGESWVAPDAASRAAIYQYASPRLSRTFQPAAQKLAEVMGAPVGRVLDVGAGGGVWSLEMLALDDNANATGLDMDAVLGGYVANAKSRGVEARIRVQPDDYHEMELAPEYDRVLLANVLHMEPAARARPLLQRAVTGLKPGGALVVVDAMSAREEDELQVAVYRMHLGLRVADSELHAPETLITWLRELGFNDLSRIELDPRPGLGAIIARRVDAS